MSVSVLLSSGERRGSRYARCKAGDKRSNCCVAGCRAGEAWFHCVRAPCALSQVWVTRLRVRKVCVRKACSKRFHAPAVRACTIPSGRHADEALPPANFAATARAHRTWREGIETKARCRNPNRAGPTPPNLLPGNCGLRICLIPPLRISPLIDGRDFPYPLCPAGMIQIHDRFGRPMKVISHEGYLLVQHPQGVAHYPPAAFISTSNGCEHCGQMAGRLAFPLRLMRL
jgi:hypothetical protein